MPISPSLRQLLDGRDLDAQRCSRGLSAGFDVVGVAREHIHVTTIARTIESKTANEATENETEFGAAAAEEGMTAAVPRRTARSTRAGGDEKLRPLTWQSIAR